MGTIAVPARLDRRHGLLGWGRVNRSRPFSRLLGLAWAYRRTCVPIILAQVVILLLGLAAIRLAGLAVDVIRHDLDPTAPAPVWPFQWTPPASFNAGNLLVTIGVAVLLVAGAKALLSYR